MLVDAALLLDFDGVIATKRSWLLATGGRRVSYAESLPLAPKAIDVTLVARVQQICDEAKAGVLLVTGWRRDRSFQDLTGALRDAGLTAPILGVVGGVKMSADLRAQASREWLDEHPEIRRWCVLDDTRKLWFETRHYTHVHGNVTVNESEECVPDWLDGAIVSPVDGVTEADVGWAIIALQAVRR